MAILISLTQYEELVNEGNWVCIQWKQEKTKRFKLLKQYMRYSKLLLKQAKQELVCLFQRLLWIHSWQDSKNFEMKATLLQQLVQNQKKIVQSQQTFNKRFRTSLRAYLQGLHACFAK